MIKFKFKGLEGGTIHVNAPDCWEDVLVKHFVNPDFLARDSISLLSSLSGIDRNTLLNSKEDIAGQLIRMVGFISIDKNGFNIKEKPERFKLMGVDCLVPKDIELERVGQKILFQDAMVKHKFIYQGIPEAIAIYLAPELNNGEFDDSKLPEIIEAVMGLRLVDVFPIADFFLIKCRLLMRNGKLY